MDSHKVLGSYLLIVIAARVRQPVREINAHAHESGHNRCSWTIRNERPACVLRSPTRPACNGFACTATPLNPGNGRRKGKSRVFSPYGVSFPLPASGSADSLQEEA